MRLGGLLLLLAASCSGPLPLPDGWTPEGPIDCRAELSVESVGLMQPVELTVWGYFEREEQPSITEPPVPAGFVGDLTTEMRRHEKGWLVRREFRLRPTRLGTVKIESMKLSFDEHATTTPALELQVTSVLGSEHDPKAVEEPAAPFPAEMALWPFWAGAGGVLLGGLLVWWWRRRAARPVRLPVEVPLPPHARALRALERLRQAEYRTEEQIESFFIGVSGVLREYLEERFGLHAPLRSTEEFLIEVESGDTLSLSQRQALRQFLQQCDLVKFARMFPGVDVHDQTLRTAESFVEQTRDDVIQAEPPLEKAAVGDNGGVT